MADDLALRILLSAQDMASSIIKNVGGSLQGMGNSASGASPGLAMAASGAALVAGAILSTIQPAADFQTQLTSLVTGAGEAQSNLSQVSSGILQLATDTGTSTTQLTSGMYQIESAGYHGADGLNVLKSAAEGAKVGNADLAAVSNGLTTALTDYHEPASKATAVTNDLIATVANGKTTMDALASSLSNILPASSAAGVSLTDTSAAMATLTGEGVPASQAATYLKQTIIGLDAPSSKAASTLKSFGLTTEEVSTKMKQSLPDALQMITDAVGKKFPAGSAQYLAAIKDISGGSKTMMGMLDLTGSHLQTLRDNVTNISGAVKKGGDSITGWALVQQTFNQKMAQAQEALEVLSIKIGTALLPVVTQIVGAIGPVVGAFSNWIDWLGKANLLMPILVGILAGCAALILAVVVPAFVSMAVSAITATWPFYLVAAAIAAVVAAFIYFYNNSKPFKAFIDGLVKSVQSLTSTFLTNLQPTLQGVGSFLQSTFAPVWKELQDVWKSQILPSLNQLISVFNQVKPQLIVLAQFIGGVLVVAFGLLVAYIGGVIGALSGIIQGVARIIGGVIQIISGYVQVIMGVVSFLVDLFTGHFDKLGGDLKVIFGGIQNIFSGFGNVIGGIVDTVVKGITGAFSGMATSAINYFNMILHGADDKTKQASIAAQTHTAEMKDKTIENAQKMNEETQIKYQNMRDGIESQLRQTTDVVKKHSLETKLVMVEQAQESAQQAGQKYVDMRNKSQEQLDLLKQGVDVSMMSAADKAKYHALVMKDNVVQAAIDTDTQTVDKIDHMRLGIIDELNKTQDAAKKHALEIQLTQVTHAEQAAKDVKDKHVKMRTDVESEMDKLKSGASQKFGSIQKDVQNIVGNTGKWIQDKWKEAVNNVAGSFIWLYNHNYYFKDLVDTIKKWISDAQKWLNDTWKTVQNDTAAAWNWLVDHAKQLWKDISQPFISAWNDHIKGPLDSLGNSIKGVWDGIANTATQWGKNVIQSIVNGINSMGKDVEKSASDIAAKIAKFLGFHSPAKEGPGAEADIWAPNLVKMYSKGILDGVPQIQNAVNKLSLPIANNLNPAAGAFKSGTSLQGGSTTTNNSGGTTVINNYYTINVPQGRLDRASAQQMAKIISDEMSSMQRRGGNLFTSTSGGRS